MKNNLKMKAFQERSSRKFNLPTRVAHFFVLNGNSVLSANSWGCFCGFQYSWSIFYNFKFDFFLSLRNKVFQFIYFFIPQYSIQIWKAAIIIKREGTMFYDLYVKVIENVNLGLYLTQVKRWLYTFYLFISVQSWILLK